MEARPVMPNRKREPDRIWLLNRKIIDEEKVGGGEGRDAVKKLNELNHRIRLAWNAIRLKSWKFWLFVWYEKQTNKQNRQKVEEFSIFSPVFSTDWKHWLIDWLTYISPLIPHVS